MTPSSASAASSSSSWFSGIVRGRSVKTPAGSGSGSISNPSAASEGFPGSRKNQMRGVLFKYGPKSVQVLFALVLDADLLLFIVCCCCESISL